MTFKVLILGDAGVGKTSIRTRFIHETFTVSYRATLGANFLTKTVTLPGPPAEATSTGTTGAAETATLCLWDTCGQERFNALSPTFFRGADCAVLVYDLDRPRQPSLASLASHRAHFCRLVGARDPVILVVGNKADAIEVEGDGEDATAFRARRDHVEAALMPASDDGPFTTTTTTMKQSDGARGDDWYFEVSAKTGRGLSQLFTTCARKCLDRAKAAPGVEMEAFQVEDDRPHGNGGRVDLRQQGKGGGGSGSRGSGPLGTHCAC